MCAGFSEGGEASRRPGARGPYQRRKFHCGAHCAARLALYHGLVHWRRRLLARLKRELKREIRRATVRSAAVHAVRALCRLGGLLVGWLAAAVPALLGC